MYISCLLFLASTSILALWVNSQAKQEDESINLLHVECPVGDAVIPKLSIVGASMGGIDHLGADITNVTVYLPKDSNEVWVTVRLNGLGRADPTIEKNSTWVRVNIFSD